MTEAEEEEFIRHLAARYGAERSGAAAAAPVSTPATPAAAASDDVDNVVSTTDALRTLVTDALSRFRARTDRKEDSVFMAASFAPMLAGMIDHTALKPETSLHDIHRLCDEARQFGFATVCVHPCYVPIVAERLSGSSIDICTVVGFPLGANQSVTKAREAELAVAEGASEIDMVLNVGMLKSARYASVESDIQAVASAVKHGRRSAITKVILETALLTDEEKVIACRLAHDAGADFVKTSTGFSHGGATAPDVALLRGAVGADMGVKASGGIRSTDDAMVMIAHGADRIGASASVEIVRGLAAAEWW